MTQDLERLYKEAKQALKAKEYDRATEALKQILMADENYKDASRLLARIVKIKRRRWYNDIRLWGPVIGVAAAGLLLWLAPKMTLPAQVEANMTLPANSPTAPVATSTPEIPTRTPKPTATAIPLQWRRIAMGLEFPRDYVTVIAVDPEDHEVMYVGTMNAGVYGSINGGESWQPLHNGLEQTTITNLVIDPTDPQTLYAGTPLGLYRSTNRGQTWISAGKGFPDMHDMPSLLIDPQNGQHLYYAGVGGLFESLDGGSYWSRVNDLRLPSLAIDPVNGELLYTVTEINGIGGLYRSEDGGQSWTMFGLTEVRVQDYTPECAYGGNVWVHPENGQIIFATVPDRLGTGTLNGTFDGGVHWYQYKETLLYVDVLAFGPEDTSLVFFGSWNGAVHSLDIIEGRLITVGTIGEESISAIHYLPEENRLLAASDGLYSHIHGTYDPWSGQSGGLPATRLEFVQSPNQGEAFIETGRSVWNSSSRIFRSRDDLKNWTFFLYGYHLSIDPDGRTMYRRTNNGDRQISRDAGATWSTFPFWGNLLIANPYVSGLVYFFDYGSPVRYSTNHGATWEDSTEVVGGYENLAFFTAADGEQIYALIDGQVIRSTDGGKKWRYCASLEKAIPLHRSILAFTSGDEGQVFIGTSGSGIYRSHEFCNPWQQSNNGLGNLFVNTIAIDPGDGRTIYAGTDGGAYISFDGGVTWGQVNDGLLGATVIYSILVDGEGNVYAATPYGIFSLVDR